MQKETGSQTWRSMPWLFNVLVKSAKRIERFDYRRPATLMSELEADINRTFEQQFEREEDSDELSDFRVFRSRLSLNEVKSTLEDAARVQKKLAAADARYSLILKLIHHADAQVPLVAYFAMQPYLDPAFLRRLCEPIDLLQQAETGSGEVRARALVRAIRETAEMLYDPYLRMLWKLSWFVKGDRAKDPPKFGALVKSLSQRLSDYPGLIEDNAGWLRNAASHARWYYVPGKKKLMMWDRNRTVQEIALNELERIANRMYSIAGPTAFSVVGLYVLRDVFLNTGLLDLAIDVLPDLFCDDQSRWAQAESAFREKVRPIFGPLEAFQRSMN